MGINMNEAFPSKWLKAADIDGDTPVTIKRVSMEEVGDDDRKPVVWFFEMDKGMVLNKTNANNVMELYGPDTDNWLDQPMTLATAMVDFQGKSMRALRLYPPPRRARQQAPAQTSHQRPLDNRQNAYDQASGGSARQRDTEEVGPREFAPLNDDIPF